MADKKFDLVFNASLEVGQVKTAVASLTKSLESAGAKIPQSITTNLNRMIQSLNTELNKLEGMTDIQLDPKNAKNVGKSYEKIFQTFQQIKVALGDIHRTAGIDPEKFFPSEVADNISEAAQAVQKYKKAMEAGIKTDEHTQASKDIAKATKEAEDLQKKLNEAIRKRDEASNTKQVLQGQRAELQAKKDVAEAEVKAAKEEKSRIDAKVEARKKLEKIEEKLDIKKSKREAAVTKAAQVLVAKTDRETMTQGKGTDTVEYQKIVQSYEKQTEAVRTLSEDIEKLEAQKQELLKSGVASDEEQTAAINKVTEATDKLSEARAGLKKNQTAIDAENTRYATAAGEIQTLTPAVEQAEQALEQLRLKKQQLEANFEQSTFNELIQELENLGVKLPDAERNMEGVEKALKNMATEAKDNVVAALKDVKDAADGIDKPLGEVGEKANNVGELGEQAKRAEQDMENLKNQVLDFFSITNTIQIFKNAIRDAFDTVKELDAAMTETAVVTDFSVGDMWEKLPQYSEEATKLGASIKSLYEATTLYYQQGLNSEQAMDVGIETMKMARIANMDAAAATEAMTAALRGFNMEINEMSATRINDVYSELAAVTAADTSQIATAMSKTASIAESANMEFETTAALLAQIIETTQEAPETAGTALKTIIARFTEVKQLFSEGMLTGEDSEGEEININKIDAALKTVGISLKDFLNGTKGIDDIFLELASKWDTLDLATQRYIATTAAGSRQQSRFIAMMSNYDRTMELVTAANNSAGASQKQFDKTLESMEAKLQKLKNAWDQFTMGLANNEILKSGVDLLTKLLTTINNLTETISGGNGVVKSVLNLGVALMGLKTGGAILNGVIASIGHAAAGKGFNLAANIKTSFGNTFAGLKNFKPKVPKIEFDTAGLTAYQASLTSLQGTYQQVAVARAQYDSIAVAGNAQQAAAIALDDAEIAAEQQLAATSAQLAAATGLENAAAQEAVLLNSQGLSLELSVAAAKAGVTAAELKETAVKQLGTGATEAAVAAKMKEILAEKGIFVAINTGIMGRLEEIAMTKLGIFSTMAKVAADTLETLGIKAKTAAMIASLGAYIAVAGAVWVAIKAISFLNEQYKNSTPEGKLKKAQERTKAASEAAEEAAESYNNLKNSLEEIDSKKTDLDQLIKGTQEWRDTVLDLNQQVMKLIDLYPKLGRFVSSENGVLSIDYDKQILQNGQAITVDSVIEEYQWRAFEAEQAHVVAQIGEKQVEIINLLDESGLTTKFSNTSWEFQIITYEDIKDLAKKVAMGEFTRKKQVDDWFAERGASAPIGYSLTELGELGHKILNLEQSVDAFTDAIIASAITMEGFGDTVGEQMVQQLDQDILRANYNTQYQKLLEEEYAEITDDMKDRYAELKGYTYNEGKFWKKDEDGEKKEVPITDEEIRTQLASIDASKELTKSLDKLSEVISGKSVTQREFIENVFSNDGAGITNATLDKYTTYDERTKSYIFDKEKYDLFAEEAGFKDFGEMAEDFGILEPEMKKFVEEAFSIAGDRIKKERETLLKNMTKFTPEKELRNYGTNANLLAGLEAKYGESIYGTLTDIFDQLDLTGDEAFSSDAYAAIRNILMEATAEEAQDAIDFFNELDFRNPIEALDKINEEIKTGSGYSRELALALKESGSSYLSVSSQISSLIKSSDFSEIKEDLDEIIEKNETISASDVLDLADSYKILNKFLKNNKVSAAGLAKVLEEIRKGELAVEDLTESVMASISSFDSLDSIVAKTVKNLEDFDLGVDEDVIGETLGDFSEILNENLEKGAVGNSQNFKILDYLFPGWREGLSGDEMVERMQYLAAKVTENTPNMRKAWSDLAAGQNYLGKAIELTEENQERFKNLQVDDTGSEILFSGWEGQGLTSEDLVDWISDAYDVSREMASMMLADFKNYSADLAIELKENDFAAGMKKTYDTLRQFGDLKLLDEKEIETMAKLWDVDPDKIKEALSVYGEIRYTNFYKEDGSIKSYEEIAKTMDEIIASGGESGKKWSDSFISSVEDGVDIPLVGHLFDSKIFSTLDFTALEKELDKLGISGQYAETIKQEAFSAIKEGLGEGAQAGYAEVQTTLANGDVISVKVTPDMTYEEYQQQVVKLTQANENEALAQAIADAFSNIEIKATIKEDTILEFREQLEGTEFDVNAVISEEAIEAIDTTLTNTINVDRSAPVTVIPNMDQLEAGLRKRRTVYVDIVPSDNEEEEDGGGGGGIFNYIKSLVPFSKGVKSAPIDYGDSLVSEEGPELIQKKDGTAYLSGTSGPEIANIEKGDTVYTAEETEEILTPKKHNVLPRYASGYGEGNAYNANSGGKGAGAKSDDDKEDWENPFDKLYNLVREISEELRQRERIERRYEKLLESVDLTAGKLFSNAVEQLRHLEKEKLLNKELQESRRWQIQQYQQENTDLMKYAKIVQNERGEDVLRIHWDQIDLVEDPDQGERIENYVSQLEEWMDGLNDIEDALNDIEDRIEEVMELGKEEYLDLEKTIKDSVEFAYQEEIDKLSQINESINDTNTELINALNKQINRIRQQRENEKTERELEEKQRQLLYLSQDTSGANDLAIMELQKEIDEGAQDYTDTLIDQKIEELEQQNEEAALQREQQITILQAQLDYLIQSGEIWDEVYSLMDEGLDPEAGLVRGSRLEQMLKNAESFQGMSKIQQMEWLKELQQQVAQAVLYMRLTTEKIDTAVTLNKQNYFGSTTPEPSYSGNSGGSGSGGSGGSGGYGGSVSSEETNMNTSSSKQDKVNKYRASIPELSGYPALEATGNSEAQARERLGVLIDNVYNASLRAIESKNAKADKKMAEKLALSTWVLAARSSISINRFKTGGLADFTGPAWLDGTKSRPELVLNQKDTQNFIQLKDILGSLMNRSMTNISSENNGDITYDIDINVESIGNDYDVEQVANKVKSLINEDARYRNNNAISLKR